MTVSTTSKAPSSRLAVLLAIACACQEVCAGTSTGTLTAAPIGSYSDTVIMTVTY